MMTTSRPAIVAGMSTKQLRLVGAHEIRIRLGGVSRQRAYQITSRADFPKPIADLVQGKVWLAEDVEAWMAVHRSNKNDSEQA
jgi:prophage regulatory protein